MEENNAKFTADEIIVATGAIVAFPCLFTGEFQLAIDNRKNCADALFIALKGESFDAHDFLEKAVEQHAAAIMIERRAAAKLNPQWQIPILVVEDTLKAYWQLAQFHRRRFPALKVAALTGSVGKTSVKEMTKAVCIEACGGDASRVLATVGNTNNHFGVPYNLLRLNAHHKYAVIELGTSGPGEIGPLAEIVEPDVAAVNTIAACHLEKLGSLEGVAEEKSSIFTYLRRGGSAIFPAECAGVEILEKRAAEFNIIRFGKDVKSRYLGGNLDGARIGILWANGANFELDWHLSGAHQAANAACAAALGTALGVDQATIASGLAKTELPGMRMCVKKINGVNWILDAYNANPESMTAALNWLSEFADRKKLLLVLGDMLELGEFEEIGHINALHLAAELFLGSHVVLVGARMRVAAEKIQQDRRRNWSLFNNSIDAAVMISTVAKEGFTVLVKGSRGIALEKSVPAGVIRFSD